MAEGYSGKAVCPFYLYSSCPYGDRCKYSHDAPTSNRNVACYYYLKGICKHGDNCWFVHSSAKGDIDSGTSSRHDLHTAGPSQQQTTISSQSPPVSENNLVHPKPICKFQDLRSKQRDEASACGPNTPNWVNAPEFIPRPIRSYADTLKSNASFIESKPKKLDMELCPHYLEGQCPYNDECPCLHGELCELCNKYCLDPYDERQRKLHIEYCEKEIEKDMELSFAIQSSLDKTCGICMDVIMEKEPMSERRFGILENCNHVFCLSCIRRWRKVKSFEIAQNLEQEVDPSVTRGCPECRVFSDFITPSQYWVDTVEEKKNLIAKYKDSLSKKPCKYFKQGKGTCPFGGACFYLHARPDGTKVELPLPTRRRRQNQDGEMDIMEEIILWDFLEGRDANAFMQLDLNGLLDPMVYGLSDDSDDVLDSSEEDFFISEAF